RKHTPDLAIIDMAIRDVPPPLLISSIQQWAPQARVMLIPVGDMLPDEIRKLPVQGILRKPFFIGDLGRQIARALGTHTKPLAHLPPPLEKLNGQDKPRVRQIVQKQARSPVEPADPDNAKGSGSVDPPMLVSPSGERQTELPSPLDNLPRSASAHADAAGANSGTTSARPRV